MFLTYYDLAGVFPDSRGIKDNSLSFQTVSLLGRNSQPKGLYIPILDKEDKLQEAIANGAVAAIWEAGKEVPKYTPNHFPLMFTNDLLEGVKTVLLQYKLKLKHLELEHGNMTNFLFTESSMIQKFLEAENPFEIEKQLEIISSNIFQEGGE